MSRTSDVILTSDVLRKAAELVDAKSLNDSVHYGVCYAIDHAGELLGVEKIEGLLSATEHANTAMWFVFSKEAQAAGPWGAWWGRNFADDPSLAGGFPFGCPDSERALEQVRDRRVLALLLLADILEYGDNVAWTMTFWVDWEGV